MKSSYAAMGTLILAFSILTGCAELNESSASSEPTKENVSATASTKSVQSAIPTQSAKPKPTEVAFDWKTSEVTEENVKKALAKAGGGLAVKVTDKTLQKVSVILGDVVLDIKPEQMQGGRIYTRQIGESMIAYSKVLFKNPQVEKVVLNGHVDTTDGDEAFGAQLVWTRETNEKIDYDELETEALGDLSAPYRIGESYSLKPIVMNELKDEDKAHFE